MHVTVHGASTYIFEIEQIVCVKGAYFANVTLDGAPVNELYRVEDLVSAEPPRDSTLKLRCSDIRAIVILADMELEKRSKKELLAMGEEGYYENVFKAFEAYRIDTEGVCAANKAVKEGA